MIQRIQSLYLLAVALLTGSLFWLPLATFTGGDEVFKLYARGVRAVATGEWVVTLFPMFTDLILSVAVALVVLFLFKRRRIQIGLCLGGIVLLAGLQVFIGIYLWRAWQAAQKAAAVAEEARMVLSAGDFFPLVSILLMWLAFRAIVRDESLVRSLDRIR